MDKAANNENVAENNSEGANIFVKGVESEELSKNANDDTELYFSESDTTLTKETHEQVNEPTNEQQIKIEAEVNPDIRKIYLLTDEFKNDQYDVKDTIKKSESVSDLSNIIMKKESKTRKIKDSEDIDMKQELDQIVYSIDSDQQSFTVIRSMIHSSDINDLDDSMSDYANSSSEGFSINEKSRNTSLLSSPLKQSSVCQDYGDSRYPVGSQVEAKDFADIWHPAKVVDTDPVELEVLLRYEGPSHKNDEWISTSSPRIRGYTGVVTIPKIEITKAPSAQRKSLKLKLKPEQDKLDTQQSSTVEYEVGERCLARWSDNRRFPATVKSVMGNGKYEIHFDDGISRICQWFYLSKMKKKKQVAANSSSSSLVSASTSNMAQSSSTADVPSIPIHRHLFDPELDYLGPKSERRAMKKKLDVKTLFNIGKRNTPRILKRKPTATDEGPSVKKKMETKIKIEEEFTRLKTAKVKPEVNIIDPIDYQDAFDLNTNSTEDTTKEISVKRRKSGGRKPKPKTYVDVNKFLTIKLEPFAGFEPDDIPLSNVQSDMKSYIQLEPVLHCGTVENDPETSAANIISDVKDATVDGVHSEINNISEGNISEGNISEANINEANISEANISLDAKDNVDIDEGLKLIAQAVTSFGTGEQTEDKQIEDEVEPTVAPVEPKLNELPTSEILEAKLREGEWCCKWVDGEPQGLVVESEIDVQVKGDQPVLPRKSVWVEDTRLPPEWKKILVRRCYGNSAGKWDIVLVDPNNRRLRDKGEMRNYISLCQNEQLKEFEHILMDFSVHRKLARQMGWEATTADGARLSIPFSSPKVSPIKVKLPFARKKTVTSDGAMKKKKKRLKLLTPDTPKKSEDIAVAMPSPVPSMVTPLSAPVQSTQPLTPTFDGLPLINGCVYVGSMKVQIIENLFRCPAEGCFKNFRKDNLLRMHIKHYHRELRKFLGDTPKVSDLAYARTAIPENTIVPKLKCEGEVKPKIKAAPKTPTDKKDILSGESGAENSPGTPITPTKSEVDSKSSLTESPKLRNALEHQTAPTKRPKLLYPVRREITSGHSSPLSEELSLDKFSDDMNSFVKLQRMPEYDRETKQEPMMQLDFETAISTHTVAKPPTIWKRKNRSPKKPKVEGVDKDILKKKKKKKIPKWLQFDDWDTLPTTEPDLESQDLKIEEVKTEMDAPMEHAPPIQDIPKQDQQFMISDTGEKIKIVHMKREEIINCHCGFGEEDGLMIQCDLCLCWQHALCHNYDTNTVPDKYTCSICVNPRRGRPSKRFLHDQSWLYDGQLPGAAPDETLRRAHELTGNLLRLTHVLHTLRLKLHVASKKDHPKLYLWAKDWETSEENTHKISEPLNHVDINEMFREIGKENLPLKDVSMDEKSSLSMEMDGHRDEGHMASQTLLANLLSSPGGGTLDLPISTSELERLAKSVQEAEVMRSGPEPEAAIESSACRNNLLSHIQRMQTLIDAKLDSIEAQVAELESQEQSFEDDETAEFFPRTKQTIQMLYRDLDTLEEIGIIT